MNIPCIVLSRPQIQSFRVIREHLRWTKSGELAKDVQSNKDAQMYRNFYIFNLKEPYDGTKVRYGPYRSNSVLSSLKHLTLEFHWHEVNEAAVHLVDWLAKILIKKLFIGKQVLKFSDKPSADFSWLALGKKLGKLIPPDMNGRIFQKIKMEN